MRRLWVPLLLVGCGRIGFGERLAGDGGSDAFIAGGFSKLVAYADQTCALHDDGRLYCWGENGKAQVGDASTTNRERPTAVAVPAGSVTSFAQGDDHACAIVDDNLYCWGESFAVMPTLVTLPAPALMVDAGQDFTCVVADRLYCWGVNAAGQLGDTSNAPKLTPSPVAIAGTIVGIDAGDDHACAITDADVVSCWGHNDDGALGIGSFQPQSVLTPSPVVAGITTLPRLAGWHACSLQGGQVRCWGRNTEGELGDGGNANSATPILVSLAATDVLATGGGPADRDATCAATGGDVTCWGAGLTGRLGNGQTTNQNVPVPVIGLPGVTVRELAIGYGHACALLVDGELWCWGRGDAGQLGNGTFANSLAPVRVSPPS